MQISQKNTCVGISFLIRFQAFKICHFIIKRFQQKCFPVKFGELLKTPRWLLLMLTSFHVGINFDEICHCMEKSKLANLKKTSTTIPLENIRKSDVFWCFQEVYKWNNDLKWINIINRFRLLSPLNFLTNILHENKAWYVQLSFDII